jgi:hypothetical protein
MFVALLLPLLSCHEPLSCDRSSIATSAVTEPARAKPPTKRTVFTWRPETCRDFSVKKWDWSINHDLELLAQKTLQKRFFFVFLVKKWDWSISHWTMIWNYWQKKIQKTRQKRFHQVHEQLVFRCV